MNPNTIAAAGTEHAHQCALFCWAANQQLADPQYAPLEWLYAVPNGGERNPIVAARLKAEGVKSGVSDLFLPVPRRSFSGFYIEMKKPGGKESQNQKDFGAFVSKNGFLYACFDHWEKARDGLIWYLT